MDYLTNLALIHLNNYCDENKIDCSRTHVEKKPQKQKYFLVKDDAKKPVASVEFHKSSVPTYES